MVPPKLDEAAIFNLARRIEGAEARRLYLQQACGDDTELMARVEALLRVHDQTHGFLESPTEELSAALSAPAGPSAGATIGRYRLLRKLGEGGMGTVFQAEQTHPVHRQVALKIIKPGLDSRQVIARFEAERQALALMDHPNIAKVLDVGTVGEASAERQAAPEDAVSGPPPFAVRPYFVMELVTGVPLTQYCDEQRVTLQERLQLFVPVCRAVQHAHQKGIIHRDLKPSNVLVGLYDDKPVPKIIDFGVAKAIGTKLTERTLSTEFGLVIGTLEYMSPEQAQPGQLDIDTRSDIYSLGVLLYELLTGTTPLRAQRLEEAALLELLRVVREEDPPRPSTRLSTTEHLPSVAANRGLEPKKLTSVVRGDLDWIVMKCLDKDRARRYDTAAGLARDIERYLQDEPVEARPPSAVYRLRKFARKNRRLLVTSVAFVLLLVLGAVASVWQAIRATAAQHLAQANEQQAVAEKGRADEEAAIARAVNDFLQNDLLGQADISNQEQSGARNRAITVRELLDRAARAIDTKFQGQQRTEAAIRLTLGKAYQALGEYPEAQKHLERSRTLRQRLLGGDHPDTLQSLNSLGSLHLARGQYDAAEPIIQQTLEARRAQLGPDHPDTLDSMDNLGVLLIYRGRFDQAESLYQEIVELRRLRLGPDDPGLLESMNNLAVVYLYRGRFREAEPLLKQVRQGFRDRLGLDHPRTLSCTNNLASCCMELNRYDEAEPLYKEVLDARRAKLGPDHPDTLFSMNFVGLVLKQRGKYPEAEPLLRQVLDGRLAKLGPDHVDTLTSECNLASVLAARGRYQEAETLFQKALEGSRAKLGPHHPETLHTLSDVAGFYQDRGQLDRAERLFQEAVTGAKRELGLDHPQTHIYIDNLADVRSARGKPELSEQALRELVDFLRQKSGADSAVYAGQLARLGQNLLAQKRYAEAESKLRDSLAFLTKIDPEGWATFDAQSLLGGALLGQTKYADAEPLLMQGYEGLRARQARISTSARFHLIQALERLVLLYDAWSKPDKAANWRKKLQAEKSKDQK
jgi:serine/threonine protein kinase/tetratricopeptide (TPR) repeat protein